MKNVFDFKRFGKYFAYDLNNAWSNYGISALVIGLLPLIMLIFSVIFELLLKGETTPMPLQVKVVLFSIAFLVVILSAPVKLYGRLTERRVGSDWLMIPASPFEKFLSMAIMLCIVLPVAVFGLFAVCDLLLGWIVPAYGGSIVRQTAGDIPGAMTLVTSINGTGITGFGVIALVFLSWCASILPFGLGAVCFKKGKAAKTILCIFALEVLFSILLVIIFRGGFDTGFDLGQWLGRVMGDMTAGKVQFLINLFINVSYLVVVGGLLVALFFRIKTIKH